MRPTLIIGGVLGALAVIVFGSWFLLPNLVHDLWGIFRATWLVFVPVIVVGVLGAILIFAERGIGWLLAVAAGAWLIGGGFVVSYMQGHELSKSVTVSESSPNELQFRERAPFDVAAATSKRTLGNTTGDATGTVKAIPTAGDNGEFTTSVIRRGAFKGYESTQVLTPPLFGGSSSKDVRFCSFSEDAELRFGGAGFNNNLDRAIALKVPLGTNANKSDAFVVCDGETPKVYAPLTVQKGFAITKRVPAGVAVYNGKTGELTVEKDYKGNLPVYPASITEAQRKSTTDAGSFFDSLFGRVGFEDTGKDEDDPNGDNRAEFGLSNLDGTQHKFVTPLNSRGSSSSIIALGVGNGSTVEHGELNEYAVYKYPQDEPRQANSAVAASITGEVLGGYKAQGLNVFEIVPAGDGKWVASIGKSQSILYRAVIDEGGTITLTDEAGEGEGESASADAGKPLSEMSVEELQELGSHVLRELGDR